MPKDPGRYEMRAFNWIGALFMIACLSVARPAVAEEFILDGDVTACEEDPRYKVGGAAMGDCLLEISERVDAEIEAVLSREEDRFCAFADRVEIAMSQRDWESYRRRYCNLIERSPGNTVSFINSAVCHLLLGRQRLEGLRLQTEYSRPICPAFALVEEASRYGIPDDTVVPIAGSGLEWQVVGSPGDMRLDIRDEETKQSVASVDLSRCNFCTGKDDNCAQDGIFVMLEKDTSTRPAIFHVCHVGAHSQRLQLVDPVTTGSEIVLDVTGAYYLDWEIASGRLNVLPDESGSDAASWPRE